MNLEHFAPSSAPNEKAFPARERNIPPRIARGSIRPVTERSVIHPPRRADYHIEDLSALNDDGGESERFNAAERILKNCQSSQDVDRAAKEFSKLYAGHEDELQKMLAREEERFYDPDAPAALNIHQLQALYSSTKEGVKSTTEQLTTTNRLRDLRSYVYAEEQRLDEKERRLDYTSPTADAQFEAIQAARRELAQEQAQLRMLEDEVDDEGARANTDALPSVDLQGLRDMSIRKNPRSLKTIRSVFDAPRNSDPKEVSKADRLYTDVTSMKSEGLDDTSEMELEDTDIEEIPTIRRPAVTPPRFAMPKAHTATSRSAQESGFTTEENTFFRKGEVASKLNIAAHKDRIADAAKTLADDFRKKYGVSLESYRDNPAKYRKQIDRIDNPSTARSLFGSLGKRLFAAKDASVGVETVSRKAPDYLEQYSDIVSSRRFDDSVRFKTDAALSDDSFVANPKEAATIKRALAQEDQQTRKEQAFLRAKEEAETTHDKMTEKLDSYLLRTLKDVITKSFQPKDVDKRLKDVKDLQKRLPQDSQRIIDSNTQWQSSLQGYESRLRAMQTYAKSNVRINEDRVGKQEAKLSLLKKICERVLSAENSLKDTELHPSDKDRLRTLLSTAVDTLKAITHTEHGSPQEILEKTADALFFAAYESDINTIGLSPRTDSDLRNVLFTRYGDMGRNALSVMRTLQEQITTETSVAIKDRQGGDELDRAYVTKLIELRDILEGQI